MTKVTPIKELNSVIDTIVENGVGKNSANFTRNRKLPADTLIKTILNMQGNSINKELYTNFDMENRMTVASFVSARGKLKDTTFEDIFNSYNATHTNRKTLNGYDYYAIDGTDFNTPYTPDSKYKIQMNDTKAGCMIHGNILFDLTNRLYADCILEGKNACSERDAAIKMIEKLPHNRKSIVIMDRGYDGFNMYEHCNRINNLYYVIRTKAGVAAIKEIKELPNKEIDKDITVTITTSYKEKNAHPEYHKINVAPKKSYKKVYSDQTRYKKWDFEDTCDVSFRVCKFKINDEKSGKEVWEVLVTNLNRFEFPLSKMKEIYHMRWDIETSFRELKYDLGGVQFHSKKDSFIIQEIYAHLTMFNVVSRTRNQIELKKKDTKYSYMLDFKMSSIITRDYFKRNDTSELIYVEMSRYLVPIRKGKQNIRELKPKSVVWFAYRVA